MSGSTKRDLHYWYHLLWLITLPIVLLSEYHNIHEFFVGDTNAAVVPSPTVYLEKSTSLSQVAALEVFLLSIILAVGYFFIKSRTKLRNKNELVKKNIYILLNGFTLLFLSWILFYVWMFLCNSLFVPQLSQVVYYNVLDILKSFISFSAMYCFLLLENPRIDVVTDADRAKRILKSSVIIALVSASTCAIPVFVRSYGDFKGFSNILVAFWGGISLQYLFSKLESNEVISRNKILLAPLYMYSLVQVTYILLTDPVNEKINVATVIMAFGLKIYFLILVIYLLAATKYFNRYLSASIEKNKGKRVSKVRAKRAKGVQSGTDDATSLAASSIQQPDNSGAIQ